MPAFWARAIIEKTALAVRIKPLGMNGIDVISNLEQRQAVLHNICARAGIRKDEGEPDFAPVARRIPETGDVSVVFMPFCRDVELVFRCGKGYADTRKRKKLMKGN